MIQNRKPIYFYSHKLTNVKINHTNTKTELLIIVETLKKPYVRKKYYYIYRPWNPDVWELYDIKRVTLALTVGILRPYY